MIFVDYNKGDLNVYLILAVELGQYVVLHAVKRDNARKGYMKKMNNVKTSPDPTIFDPLPGHLSIHAPISICPLTLCVPNCVRTKACFLGRIQDPTHPNITQLKSSRKQSRVHRKSPA
jgi:hypothetical protein